MLLGADLLKSTGINVDFVLEISAQQTQTIEPKQRSLLYGTLPQKPCVDILGLIVPCDSSELHGVKPGSTVVQVNSQNCLVPVCLVNNTEMPCLIEKGDNTASVQLLKGGDSICETVLNVKNIDSVANKQVTNESVDRQQFDDQFMLDKTVLTPVEVEDLQHVLWEYADLFQMPGQGLGHTNVLKHAIRLMPGSKIIKTAPYRCNPKVREEISKQIQDMLDQGIIKPSESPYASPVVMVTKQDGTLRFCVDFYKLNAQTIADCHDPIGCIDDSLDSLEKTFIKVTLTNLRSFVELCVKKLPIPSSLISVEVLKDKINTPKLSHCCVAFPQLNFDWDFLKISFTESDSKVELPSTFLISPIFALKYWKIKGGTVILRVTMQTGDQVKDILSHNLLPFKLHTDYIPLQQIRPLPPDQLTPP